MPPILCVDFGASRVKAIVWSLEDMAVVAEAQVPAPAPVFGDRGEVEVDGELYWAALEATAGRLIGEVPGVRDLWLCTEMHGIMLADPVGTPLTSYISWRDGRALHADDGPSSYNRLHNRAGDILARTGMRLRPGLPLVSIAHLAAIGAIPREVRLWTLADWLLWRGGELNPAAHASLAAGTGFFDIGKGAWSEELLSLAGIDCCYRVILPELRGSDEVMGRITLSGRTINVRGAIGDLQAAVHGMGFPSRGALAINLGTGSQVLRASQSPSDGVEQRPDATNDIFAVMSHIPSGRALNVFADLLDGAAVVGGGQPFFWHHFSNLLPDAVLQARLAVDLKVFAAAWRYRDGGSIVGIHEGNFSPVDLIAGIAKGWLEQYAAAIEMIDPHGEEATVLIAGGLSRRGSFIAPVIEAITGRRSILVETRTGEETLDGLVDLAMESVR